MGRTCIRGIFADTTHVGMRFWAAIGHRYAMSNSPLKRHLPYLDPVSSTDHDHHILKRRGSCYLLQWDGHAGSPEDPGLVKLVKEGA